MAAGTEPPGLEERIAALEAIVAGLVQPEPDFMAHVRTDTWRTMGGVEDVRMTHLPTGVTVLAPDRAEGIRKLRKALAGHARRQHDLQERARRQASREQRESGGKPGAA